MDKDNHSRKWLFLLAGGLGFGLYLSLGFAYFETFNFGESAGLTPWIILFLICAVFSTGLAFILGRGNPNGLQLIFFPLLAFGLMGLAVFAFTGSQTETGYGTLLLGRIYTHTGLVGLMPVVGLLILLQNRYKPAGHKRTTTEKPVTLEKQSGDQEAAKSILTPEKQPSEPPFAGKQRTEPQFSGEQITDEKIYGGQISEGVIIGGQASEDRISETQDQLVGTDSQNALEINSPNRPGESEQSAQGQAAAPLRIPTGQGDKSFELAATDLLLVEAANNYCKFHYLEDQSPKSQLIRIRMKEVEAALPMGTHFLRCHRSYIINVDRVTAIRGSAQSYRLEIEQLKDSIPVSRSFDLTRIQAQLKP